MSETAARAARESTRRRVERLPAAAHAQPRRLVSLGSAEALDAGAAQRQAAARLDRLQRLPLVPRDGARVVRGRRDRGADERALRQHQGRSRRATGPRPDLHGHRDAADRPRRLAAHGLLHARRHALLRRHLLPARAAPRPALVPPGAGRRGAGVPRAARRGEAERGAHPRGARRAAARRRARTRRGRTPRRRPRCACCRARTPSTAASAPRPSFRPPAISSCCWRPATRCPSARRARRSITSSSRCREMARGGVYDQLGGGFHRYSVDATLGGAALREDALRPGPAAARLRRGLAPQRRQRTTTCSGRCARRRPTCAAR